jgi:hypothetical protein
MSVSCQASRHEVGGRTVPGLADVRTCVRSTSYSMEEAVAYLPESSDVAVDISRHPLVYDMSVGMGKCRGTHRNEEVASR